MKVWTLSLLLMFSGCVLSDEDEGLLLACDIDDIECLSKSTTTFLEKTHKGKPEYGFVSIDPLNIPSSELNFGDDSGLVYKYNNITVTGLRNQNISEFKMNTDTKSVVLTTKADLTIVGDIIIEFTKASKSYSGSATAIGSVLGTATYSYELKDDDKGVKHFEVGPETITCAVVKTPQAQMSPELLQALIQDDDFKKIPKEKIEERRSKLFCKIIKESYKSVIHNLRVAAKLLPASSFFKNIL